MGRCLIRKSLEPHGRQHTAQVGCSFELVGIANLTVKQYQFVKQSLLIVYNKFAHIAV